MKKENFAIIKVKQEGNNTYLTGKYTLGKFTYSFTENINFAYVFKTELEAWELWNNLSNDHTVKNVAGVMTKAI
jgi:hypothetical protein